MFLPNLHCQFVESPSKQFKEIYWINT